MNQTIEMDVRALIGDVALRNVTLWVDNGELHFRAPRGTLTTELRAVIQANKSELIGELSQPRFTRRDAVQVVQYPSFWNDFWTETQANAALRHGLHFALKLSGAIELGTIEAALERLTLRHDLLRGNVHMEHGAPCLRIQCDQRPVEPLIDAARWDVTDRAQRVHDAVEHAIHSDFDAGAVFRAQIIKVSDHEFVVAGVIHHFVADGVSLGLLIREFIHELQPQSTARPSERSQLQYADYLFGMNEWLAGPGLAYRLRYWKNKMQGAPTVQFPLLSSTAPAAPGKLEILNTPVPANLRAELTRAIANCGIPFAVGLLAMNFAALAKTLLTHDLVTVLIHSGRNDAALQQLVGFTVNCFPVRITIDADISYAALLRHVNTSYDLARDYQIPWAILRERAAEMNASCTAPIFNYLPAAQSSADPVPSSSTRNNGFTIESVSVKGPAETNSVDWKSHEVHVFDNGTEMLVSVKYMPSMYVAAGAHRFTAAFLSCMEMLATDPEAKVLA